MAPTEGRVASLLLCLLDYVNTCTMCPRSQSLSSLNVSQLTLHFHDASKNSNKIFLVCLTSFHTQQNTNGFDMF